MIAALRPLVLINAVGLTSRCLAHAPRFHKLAREGWVRPLKESLPAVTCTAQATMLTGVSPEQHGVVGNGWLHRDTMEVRFWQQSNRLIQAEPIYVTARRQASEQGRPFRCAKLFWWFNQGAEVEISVTPKPWYGADGNKVFGVSGRPDWLIDVLEENLGPFPFQAFWGPMAGLPATAWIAQCAAKVLRRDPPSLTLVYLPHLDYDSQRLGPDEATMSRLAGELDAAAAPLFEAAAAVGARVWVVNEYGHVPVQWPIYPNRALRQAGLLAVRRGPFGETLETFESQALAVCDHQLAHVYVREPRDLDRTRELLAALPGVARVLAGDERRELGLHHPRAGDLVALAEPTGWFAYPFWLNDRHAPDYARTVDIHRKPGYDPCELFFDPKLWWPKGRAVRRLVQKKLGFRTLFDLVPLDASLVKGSHGLAATDPQDRPVFIGDGPPPEEETLPMTAVRDWVLRAV